MNVLQFLLDSDYGSSVDVQLYALNDLNLQVGTTLTVNQQTRSRLYLVETAIAAGEYTADIFTSSGTLITSKFVTVKLITAEEQATNYATRVADNGGSVSAEGFDYLEAVYQAAMDEGVAVSGWLFGSEVNPDLNEILNLDAAKPSLIPEATLNVLTANAPAMLGMRVDVNTENYITDDGSGFFDNTPDHSILFLGQQAGDVDPVTPGRQTPTYILDQGLGGAAGNFVMLQGVTGAVQIIDRPDNVAFQQADANTETNVRPSFIWFDTNASGDWKKHDILPNSSTAYMTWNADVSINALRLGRSSVAGSLGFATLLRFDGALSDAQRETILTKIYAAWRKLGRSVLIVGNSVTITGVSNGMKAWPKEFQRYGIYNNAFVIRMATGARRLPYFAPTGYTLPPGSPADADIAIVPVNLNDRYAANVFINDDQQNMIGANQPYSSWLDCHNAIAAHCAALNDAGRMRGVMCTQMAHAAYLFPDDPPFNTPYTYAQIAGRVKWLEASQYARVETLSGFNNIPTTIGEVYAAFNLGWDTPDDGDPPDTYDDLPQGDVSLLADPQHANDAGHAVMFDLYKTAYEAALLL